MGMTSLYVIPLVCSIGAGPSTQFDTKPAPPLPGGYISEEDARYLDYLLEDFLFDPKHAVRVRLSPQRNQDQSSFDASRAIHNCSRTGWLVTGRRGDPERIYFTDGESILAKSVKFRVIDFEQTCAGPFLNDELSFELDDNPLALAAWLYRRGYKTLAARALAIARGHDAEPREQLRNQLAKHALSQIRAAFFSGADQETLDHADRLSRLYPEFAAECHILPLVVDDLKRRQREGKLGKPAPKSLPSEFAKWDVAQKVKYLVRTLDQISQTTHNDIHMAALIEIGDAAVPALIDVVEHDNRLTRSSDLQIQSRFTHRRQGELVYVRDVALQLLGAILRVQHLDPYGDAIAIDCNPPAELAERFRQYWAQYGKTQFNDRMMGVLTDANARTSARIDAAEELIAANRHRSSNWNREYLWNPFPLCPPHAYLAIRKTPNVRQAIFEALDQELARSDKDAQNADIGWYVKRFISCLEELGDPNAGVELALRARATKSLELRLQYANAAYKLGESGPMISFARDFGAAKIELAKLENNELLRSIEEKPFEILVARLIACDLPEMHEALHLLADRSHPYYPLAIACALKEDLQDRWTIPCRLRHPVRLVFLAQKLNDFRPTGVHYYLRGDEIEISGEPRFRRRLYRDRSLPVGTLLEHAEERVAEEFAQRLSGMIVGLRPLHPLQNDVDKRLKETKAFVDLYARRFRSVTWHETEKWNVHSLHNWYVPEITPHGRPATADDVKLGRAVFELNGRGTVAKQSLPAWLVLKADAKEKKPDFGLAVQAEVDSDGKLIYGVIFRNEIRAVRADEVERVEVYVK